MARPSTLTDQSSITLPLDPTIRDLSVGIAAAIDALQGGVGQWSPPDVVAEHLATHIPPIIRARVIRYCREQGQSCSQLVSAVVADLLTSQEPALLELSPLSPGVAEDVVARLEALWPLQIVRPQPIVREQTAERTPEQLAVLAECKELGASWHRMAIVPRQQSGQPWAQNIRQQVLSRVQVVRARALQAGLTIRDTTRALEESGDRWSDEMPPPKLTPTVYLDERGQLLPEEGSMTPVEFEHLLPASH